MRILYIVSDLYIKGGIQEFAKTIYSKLKKRFNLEILNWKYDLSLPIKGIIRFSPSKIGDHLYSRYFSSHFKRKYKINDVDLIHFWDLEEGMAFLDEKYIVSCHGMEILRRNIKGGFRRRLYPKVLSNAIVIHANSNYTKKLIIKNFNINPKKIKVILPPVDFERLASIKKIKTDKIIIGTLTRFVKRKNILNVIKALNIVKEKHDLDFIYYLAGDGIEKKRILKDLKKAKFEWKYFGEISEENKIKKFYPSLDVFVMSPLDLPNDVEGFGIVYLEANAYGIPVVAAKTGGVPDAVKEGVSGTFTDPTSPEDIAIKILKVLRNKDKYSKPAKNWAKKFDVEQVAKKFAEIYNQIEK